MMANCTTASASGVKTFAPESRRRSAWVMFSVALRRWQFSNSKVARVVSRREIARLDDGGGCDDEHTGGVKISFIHQFNQLTDYEFRRVRCVSKPCC